MNEFYIKGTVCGISSKDYNDDPELFSSILISVLQTWIFRTYDTQDNLIIDINEESDRQYGRIKAAYYALNNDIHNLSVNYHLLSKLINNFELDKGFKLLYISLLVENYIINLRSIYDLTSFFPSLLLDFKDFKKIPTGKHSDSLNSLLKNIKKMNIDDINQLYPQSINETIMICESNLNDVKTIRDAIIHKGKEAIIEITNNEVYFRIPKKPPYGKENCLPDILCLGIDNNFPLIKYLKTLTIRLMNYLEQLGETIGQEFYNKDNSYRVELTALVGICMRDFKEFLDTK